MARTKGHKGKVKAGGVPTLVGETVEWEFEETGEKLDAATIGKDDKESEVGQVETTGTMRVFWDTTDVGQDALIALDNADVAVELLPGGDGSGDVRYTGNIRIEKIGRRGNQGNIVEMDFSWFSNARLTEGTVP